MTTATIDTINATHRVAVQEDMERLFKCMNLTPERVIVRDIYRDELYCVLEVAEGPFTLHREGCGFVIAGTDKRTGNAASLCIDADSVVHVKNDRFKTWTAPSFGSVRICIPY